MSENIRSGIPDGAECHDSFADLFRVVRRRDWNEAEKRAFDDLNQEQRNAWVKTLALESAGKVVTEDRTGTDGQTYTAFWIRSQ